MFLTDTESTPLSNRNSTMTSGLRLRFSDTRLDRYFPMSDGWTTASLP
jgi:hypothetical protein